MLKQRIIQTLWILAGTGTMVLLVAAMQKKSGKVCSGVQVEITGVSEQAFVDESNIESILKGYGSLAGVSMVGVDLRSIEEQLEEDPWIRKAELFFDNKQVLQVRIMERAPIARVFTMMGNSFYLDSSGMMLPLSQKLTAKVPFFTSVPFGKKLSLPDSLMLRNIISLSSYICADSFWSAQIAQVDVSGNEFTMLPLIGNHIIRFGDISDMDKKFKKLYSFYKNVSAKTGFDKYEMINLEFDGQVVATKRGVKTSIPDSDGAMQQHQLPLEPPGNSGKTRVIEKNKGTELKKQPKAVMQKAG